MKYLSLVGAAAMAVIIDSGWVGSGRAQALPPGTYRSQQAAAPYSDPYSYRLVAPTPVDAYRTGLINRWELERLEGPMPQALQGPSPDGSKGGGGNDGGFNQ